MTDFQTDSAGLQLYLKKPNLPPHTAQKNISCPHLTASTYALVPDLKSCDEPNGEEENTLQHPQVIVLNPYGPYTLRVPQSFTSGFTTPHWFFQSSNMRE